MKNENCSHLEQRIGYGIENPGSVVRSLAGKPLPTAKRSVRLWGHRAANPISITGSLAGVRWEGTDADHSPPSSAEVKKT